MTDLQADIAERDDDATDEQEEVDAEGTVSFSGVIKRAYGNTLKTPVPYKATYVPVSEYSKIPEDEFPSKKDILNSVNAARKLNERQKATLQALKDAGINKPDPNDPIVVLQTMLRNMEKVDMPTDTKDMMIASLRAQLSAEEGKRKAA